jgi:Domain of unknown function (DUF4410)
MPFSKLYSISYDALKFESPDGTELVEKITALGITAVHVEQNQQPVQNEIIITGKFLKIDEGNVVRRNLIGLGAGQSSLDSKVIVLRATPQGIKEILSFSAHADSGNMPGAAVMGPTRPCQWDREIADSLHRHV